MKKVYVVTKGEYDDYRIVGAFSSKEKAEHAVKFYKGYEDDGCEAEEFELDPIIPEMDERLTPFGVWIYREPSLGTRFVSSDFVSYEKALTYKRAHLYYGRREGPGMEVFLLAKNKEEAELLATEIRDKLVKEGKFPETNPLKYGYSTSVDLTG